MVNATCAALHCLSSSKQNKDLKFHQFPHDEQRRHVWLNACKRTDVIDRDWDFFKNKYVCGLHFQKCMYSKKNHLKKTAVPLLLLAEKPMRHDSYTQTWESIKYVKPYLENNVGGQAHTSSEISILYFKPNLENKEVTTSQTQTEEFMLDIEMKKEIEGTTPNVQNAMSKQDMDLEIDANKETEDETSTFELPEETFPTQFARTSYVRKQVNKSIQTDKVIIYSFPRKRNQCNPQYCHCPKIPKIPNTDYEEVEVLKKWEFYKGCEKFLSPTFCSLVRNQLYIEESNKETDD